MDMVSHALSWRWKMRAGEEHAPVHLPCKAPLSSHQQHVPGHLTPRDRQFGDMLSLNPMFHWVGFFFCLAQGISWSEGDCMPNSVTEKLAPHKASDRMVLIDCFS